MPVVATASLSPTNPKCNCMQCKYKVPRGTPVSYVTRHTGHLSGRCPVVHILTHHTQVSCSAHTDIHTSKPSMIMSTAHFSFSSLPSSLYLRATYLHE